MAGKIDKGWMGKFQKRQPVFVQVQAAFQALYQEAEHKGFDMKNRGSWTDDERAELASWSGYQEKMLAYCQVCGVDPQETETRITRVYQPYPPTSPIFVVKVYMKAEARMRGWGYLFFDKIHASAALKLRYKQHVEYKLDHDEEPMSFEHFAKVNMFELNNRLHHLTRIGAKQLKAMREAGEAITKMFGDIFKKKDDED
jgi:hypothetical protein